MQCCQYFPQVGARLSPPHIYLGTTSAGTAHLAFFYPRFMGNLLRLRLRTLGVLALLWANHFQPVHAVQDHPEFDRYPSLQSVAGTWKSPVTPLHIVKKFLIPEHFTASKHRGIDIAVSSVDAIYAPADGIISFHGPVAGRTVMTIDHLNGLLSTFDPIASVLRTGDLVRAGDVLGTVETANAIPHCQDGPLCIHFGVRFNGKYVHPLHLIQGFKPSVLYPAKTPIISAHPNN